MITPCSKCHKRHGRDEDHGSGSAGNGASKPSVFKSTRALVLIASLLAGSAAASTPESASVSVRKLGVSGGVDQKGDAAPLSLSGIDVTKGVHGRRKVQDLFDETDEDHEHEEDHLEPSLVKCIDGSFALNCEDHDEHEEEEGNHYHAEVYHDEAHNEIVHDEGHDEDHHDEHDEHDHEESEFITNQEEAGEPKPWGAVLGATLLVNFATLVGLLLLVVPAIRKGMLGQATSGTQTNGKLLDIVIPSFAVGALMATTIFLVLPEALHLIEGAHEEEGGDSHEGHGHRILQEEHEDHNDNEEGIAAAKLGCGFLGGFLLPVFLSIFFHHDETEEDGSSVPADEEECRSCVEKDAKFGADPQDRKDIDHTTITVSSAVVAVDSKSASVYDADEEVPVESYEGQFQEDTSLEPIATKTKTVINYRLGASILIGDAFHNFADGLFIGSAFLGCSWATAFGIMAVSLLHELAQELADFIILTRYVGLSVTQACALNFVSGLSVCLGGITVLASKPSDQAVGIILAIAGGVYVNVAACESLPRVECAIKDRSDRALTFFLIIVGTIPIGLILLNHKHC